MKLNLGSGYFPKEGFINVDVSPDCKPDVLHNLNEFPYPFESNTFEVIESNHALEHVESPLQAMIEIHRISKHNGRVTIRVPHFSRGFTHPEHRAGFDITLPYYFSPRIKEKYTGVTFEKENIRLRWFAQPYLKKKAISPILYYVSYSLGFLLDLAANASPVFCSRVWCFLVGGFEEIEFHFISKKYQ